jgi:hypothetical protein
MMTVPIQYRRGKKLFKSTVISLFPELFTSDISRACDALSSGDFEKWREEFKNEIEKELFQGQSPIDSLLNTDALKVRLWHNNRVSNKEKSFFALSKHKLLDAVKDTHPSFYYFIKKMYSLYKRAPLTVFHEELTITKVITRIIMIRLFFQQWSSLRSSG